MIEGGKHSKSDGPISLKMVDGYSKFEDPGSIKTMDGVRMKSDERGSLKMIEA